MIRSIIVCVFLASCSQGEGDVCQITADCDDGLVCNQQTARCQLSTGNVVVDAPVAVDAPVNVDSAISPVNGCLRANATDQTPNASIVIGWADPHAACTVVSVGTMVQFQGDLVAQPITGGIGGSTPAPDATSPITTATPTATAVDVTFTTAGEFPYYGSNAPTTMLGVVYVE